VVWLLVLAVIEVALPVVVVVLAVAWSVTLVRDQRRADRAARMMRSRYGDLRGSRSGCTTARPLSGRRTRSGPR
jgi:hypothetical protein